MAVNIKRSSAMT